MKITVTLQELLDKGCWDDACQDLGLNEWCINEGMASGEDEVSLTEEQAKRYGIIHGN